MCLINNKVSFLDILRALEIQKKIINKFNYSIPNLGLLKKSNASMVKFAKNLNWEIIHSHEKFIRFYVKFKFKKKFVLFKDKCKNKLWKLLIFKLFLICKKWKNKFIKSLGRCYS